jgi:hypothetical protein
MLFGGNPSTASNPRPLLGDTWKWSGSAWSQVSVAAAPSPRTGAAAAYDVSSTAAILFGGLDGTVRDDTWRFDGATWLLLNPLAHPPACSGHVMASDLGRGRIVWWGGCSGIPDTWEWDGSNWLQSHPVHAPPLWAWPATMDFDLQRHQVVLAQQPQAGAAADVWGYDGIDWYPIPVRTPIFLDKTMVATAPLLNEVVVLSRNNLFQLTSAAAAVQAYGIACGVAAPRLAAATWPRPGSPFGIDLSDNGALAPVALIAAFASANLPLAGCTLQVAPGQAFALLSSNAAGFANLPLPIPDVPTVLGMNVFFQSIVLDPAAAGGLAMSTGLQATIGD